jgi:hypothetical protein
VTGHHRAADARRRRPGGYGLLRGDEALNNVV